MEPERGPDALGPEPGSEAPALVVEALSKAYDGTLALQDLSFDARAGEIVGLVGPNGAGKTTALRSIAGVLPIHEGRVLVDGHDVARDEVEAKRRLAWVPDDPQPFDTLSVGEHLEFTAALHGIVDWRERATELLLSHGGRRYLSGWLAARDEAFWRRHHGDLYDAWLATKRTLDPNGVLTSALFPA